jgi:hypothetical protein
MNDKKTVLVVGMGTSPAVMTETVWALAHQSEPVVPDEIVVITTKSGKDTLRAAIMSGTPSVWNRLKTALAKKKIAVDGKLVFGDTSIRVIPDADGNEASDLRTGADNLHAADYMLTSTQAKHYQRPIVSGSMRHAFLFADESENGCSQPLFYVRRTSLNGGSRDSLRNWLSTDLHEWEVKSQTSFVCCVCIFSSIIRSFVNNSQWSANYENYKKSQR